MKKIIILIFILFLSTPKNVLAQETVVPNNKFGIHIIDESDLELASELVNSNGGEWGYVTVVIREDEKNPERWQRFFDQMRRLKLIPIVRLATKQEGGVWLKPSAEEANNWAAFLNGLLWPVTDRYVVLFNEPNHKKEWGGTINPEEYAEIVKAYEVALRNHSKDFKILPAALDLAAPNGPDTMDASTYWDRAHTQDNFIFTRFDIWNSHSYPNPGFSGEVSDTGKMSIQGYKWELDYLEDFGLDPEIDVFITETGWIAASSDEYEYISDNYKTAYEQIWNDPQVKAVTPFLLKYIGEPFNQFSFVEETGEKRPYFEIISSLKKIRGEPNQEHSYKLDSTTIAKSLVSNSNYLFYINLKNDGQSIWTKEDGFSIHFQSTLEPSQISIGEITPTEPNQSISIPVKIETSSRGRHALTMQLNKNGEQIGNLIQANFEIIAPPALEIRVKGWFGNDDTASDFTVILAESERQIMKIENVLAVDGLISLPFVYNVIPGREHQLTVYKNYHIAKTKNIIIKPDVNRVNLNRLIPIDLNNDSKLDYKDLVEHIIHPIKVHLLISPF